MSHFFGIVLVPKDTKKKGIEGAVSDLVGDYNEQKDVPEYERDCWCIGHQARNESSVETHRRLGTVNELREKFHKVVSTSVVPVETPNMSKEERKAIWKVYNEAEAKTGKAWKKAIEPLQKLERRLFANHPMAKKPDPACGECAGTGRYKTDANPNGKWDWWTVGGRWTGAFTPDYDASEDPRNVETCTVCRGTGKRDDELGKEQRKRDPAYTCNGCNGKGKSVKFSFAEHNGDIMPASKVPKDVFPFSIVTPDGTWHEKGEMGWFGMASNEKDEGVWQKKCSDLLKRHKDCLAVVVDYHV